MSLQEYHEQFPCAVSIPTLTQMRLVGPLMERLQREDARRARRAAFRSELIRVLCRPFHGMRRTTFAHPIRVTLKAGAHAA